MQRSLICAAAILALFLPAAAARAQGRPTSAEALTNASVIRLVRGGFTDKAVIAIISSRPASFDLSTERLIELKKRGVSEKVILAMVGRVQGTVLAQDWGDDDSFFSDSVIGGGGGVGALPRGGDPRETNIFGSSGGSRGRTRSRGANGGLEDDTEILGSASVRIIRPPAEAGGGPAKLIRTPSLTNETVVQLVEGGFSEGTIIRRIEQSPAEFDLSEKSLVQLRRRRVSEPIIAAMRSAMGEDETAPARP